MDTPPPEMAPRHSAAEDAHALLMGSSFVAFGLILLRAAGLVTSGLAGVALILSYSSGIAVGPLFIILNLPFFVLARRRMGWQFTLKSVATMIGLALFSVAMPKWLDLQHVDAAFAAVFGGSLIGMGVLSLARHRASVGGIGIVALMAQERHGISAGLVQLTTDVLIVGASLFVIGPVAVGYSAVSALALSLVMLVYHRPGRYAGY